MELSCGVESFGSLVKLKGEIKAQGIMMSMDSWDKSYLVFE